jgi:hypothetical protein
MGTTVSNHDEETEIVCSHYISHQFELDALSAEMSCSVVCIIDGMQMYVKQRIIYQCVAVTINLLG